METSSPEIVGFNGSLGLSLLSLGFVCLLAYIVLRLLAQRWGRVPSGAIRVIDRCALEARRSVYLIEIRGRHFLLGAGEGGFSALKEIEPLPDIPVEVGPIPKPRLGKFEEVLRRAFRRNG